jgi:phosphatidylinositol glycan class W
LVWKLINLPNSTHWLIKFIFEFYLFVIPQIVIFALPQYAWYMIPWLASFLLLGLLWSGPAANNAPGMTVEQLAKEPRKLAITNFRAGMMIQTIIGILAVDFSSFPRRHAKTETFGTSLVANSGT